MLLGMGTVRSRGAAPKVASFTASMAKRSSTPKAYCRTPQTATAHRDAGAVFQVQTSRVAAVDSHAAPHRKKVPKLLGQLHTCWSTTLCICRLEELWNALENLSESCGEKSFFVALAALAATASFAQSSVTISGLLDAGYRSVNAPAADADTQGVFQNGSATSTINIAGTEDLGGGMKANFRVELNADFVGGTGLTGAQLQSSAADDLAAAGTANTVRSSSGGLHQTFLGLEGGFGQVKLGRLNSGSLTAWGTGSVFGTALGSGYGSNGNIFTRYSSSVANLYQTAPTRFNNAIEYTTPSFSGLTARVLYVPKVDNVGGTNNSTVATLPGANRAGVTDIGAFYSNGPLNVALTQQAHKFGATALNNVVTTGSNQAANSTYKLTTLAANYAIGAATVYGAMWTEKHAEGTTSTYTAGYDIAGRMVGAKYVMGATTLMASYGLSNDKTSVNIDRKIVGLGADYALSKRTSLYARYEDRDANKNNSTDSSTHGSTKTTAVGVRHTF